MRIINLVDGGTAYQVSYRIKDKTTAQGTSRERYDGLIARLGKLKAVIRSGHFEDEAHTATSSWVVRSKEKSAEALVAKLGKGLTPGLDFLEVIEVVVGNWDHLTGKVTKPKTK